MSTGRKNGSIHGLTLLEGALGFGLPVIFPLLFFSLVLCFTLFTRSGVFVIFFIFFVLLVLFQVLANSPAAGGTTDCFF